MASALVGTRGEKIALTDVAVSAALRDLLAEVTVIQSYRNDEQTNIEAVYTFPLPLDAVLLDLKVEIGGRLLTGTVVEKKKAAERYEDAVADGDAAVMLEEIEPGLFTLNAGNLLAGETAKVTFCYALFYHWSDDKLRVMLPTTVAPRYGGSPHAPHQAPESSLTVENRFSLRLEIHGVLRKAQFSCPTHEVTLEKTADTTVLALDRERAPMDRDFVLNIRAPKAKRSFALTGVDEEGMAAVASFQPFFPGLKRRRDINLVIVVDCSGSMAGDSIEQAKDALHGMLDGLTDTDHATIIAFGSGTKSLSQRPQACGKTYLADAHEFARCLEADMGGTEIGPALDAAWRALGGTPGDVFLITDGEVGMWQPIVGQAKASGHRVFTVGVGSAVSEAFVRGIAAVTGGECELVSPREGMSERVLRHYQRMRSPRAKNVTIHWPHGAVECAPASVGAVFDGDTVVASARFPGAFAGGEAVLEIQTEDGESSRVAVTLAPPEGAEGAPSTVARLAAAQRIKEANPQQGLSAALAYRLVSPWTNWLVVAERAAAEKPDRLPVLRKVPQTLAAGWHGTGSVLFSASAFVGVSRKAFMSPGNSHDMMYRNTPARVRAAGRASRYEAYEAPDIEFIEARNAARTPPVAREVSLAVPRPRLVELFELDAQLSLNQAPGHPAPQFAIELLDKAGLLDDEFKDLLQHAERIGLQPDAIAVVYLALLLQGAAVAPEAQKRLAALQREAGEWMDALQQAGRHADELLRPWDRVMKAGLLQDAPRAEIGNSLQRLGAISELVARLNDLVRRARRRRSVRLPAGAAGAAVPRS